MWPFKDKKLYGFSVWRVKYKNGTYSATTMTRPEAAKLAKAVRGKVELVPWVDALIKGGRK